jgi:hypothetical protein
LAYIFRACRRLLFIFEACCCASLSSPIPCPLNLAPCPLNLAPCPLPLAP